MIVQEKFGSQCIVVAIDAKEKWMIRWEVFTHGGRNPIVVLMLLKYASSKWKKCGAGELLVTSMDRDGTQVRL